MDNELQPPEKTAQNKNDNPVVKKQDSNIPLAFFPFTPVPFTGKNAIWAYSRIGLYSIVAYAAWKKFRPLSYAAMGAAGVSVLTSLTGQAYNGK